VSPAIAATPTARRGVARLRAAAQWAPHVNGTAGVRKAASIIGIINVPIARA
jgi:hypothetical protein